MMRFFVSQNKYFNNILIEKYQKNVQRVNNPIDTHIYKTHSLEMKRFNCSRFLHNSFTHGFTFFHIFHWQITNGSFST